MGKTALKLKSISNDVQNNMLSTLRLFESNGS